MSLRAVISLLMCTLQISAASDNSTEMCPTACSCHRYTIEALGISCAERGNDPQLVAALPEDINAMLKLIKEQLKYLFISNTSLTRVPEEVCNATTLSELWLDYNQLVEFPENCFSQMKNLIWLSASYNRITYLQDSVLNGLIKLQYLSLEHNEIETIGLRTFSNRFDFPYLKGISLAFNRLTSIEPWPMIRAQASPGLIVSVEFNRISTFTNVANWTYSCSEKSIEMIYDLDGNNISHLSDFVDVYFTSIKQASCFFYGLSNAYFINNNQLFCDCMDFNAIFSIFYEEYFTLTYTFASAAGHFAVNPRNCTNIIIPQIGTGKIVSVPLDALVCDVTIQCPTNCTCTNQPSNSTFHVLCTSIELTELPDEIPSPDSPPRTLLMPIKLPKYKLDFSKNTLNILEARSYFNNTVILDVHSSQLKNISEVALVGLKKVDRIYLHDNLLRTLPRSVEAINFSFTSLSLYNNPFDCSCEQVWIKAWLISIYDLLEKSDSIQCDTPARLRGRTIWSVNETEFCYVPSPDHLDPKVLTLAISLSAVFIVCVALFLVIFRFRIEAYKRFHIHPFDRDECVGEEMEYDVFISYSRCDKDFAAELLELLENNGCKVCFHQRDFMPSRPILASIYDAICTSKRVLCFVTPRFIESGYCLHEFETAYDRDMTMKRRRLIILKHEDFVIEAETPDDINESNLTRHIDQLVPETSIESEEFVIHTGASSERSEDQVSLINQSVNESSTESYEILNRANYSSIETIDRVNRVRLVNWPVSSTFTESGDLIIETGAFAQNPEADAGDQILLLGSTMPEIATEPGCSKRSISFLREFITRNTYVNLSVGSWRDQLLYALPVNTIGTTPTLESDTNEQIETDMNLMSAEDY